MNISSRYLLAKALYMYNKWDIKWIIYSLWQESRCSVMDHQPFESYAVRCFIIVYLYRGTIIAYINQPNQCETWEWWINDCEQCLVLVYYLVNYVASNGNTLLYTPTHARNTGLIIGILKHLRQFAQSDWFLPVFISGIETRWAAPRIDPFERRGILSYWK